MLCRAPTSRVDEQASGSHAAARLLSKTHRAPAAARHRRRLDRRLYIEILRVGAPMSLQAILNNLALATLTGFVGALGAVQLAGFGVAVRLEYLLYPLAFGLGAGALAMVGTNIGAGKFARAERIAWIAAGLAAAITGCIGLFGIMLPDVWTSLFTSAPDIYILAARYLGITGCAYVFLGLGLTLASVPSRRPPAVATYRHHRPRRCRLGRRLDCRASHWCGARRSRRSRGCGPRGVWREPRDRIPRRVLADTAAADGGGCGQALNTTFGQLSQELRRTQCSRCGAPD